MKFFRYEPPEPEEIIEVLDRHRRSVENARNFAKRAYLARKNGFSSPDRDLGQHGPV